MLGKKALKSIAERLLTFSGADQTEVLIFSKDAQLTRFAANTIHQNVAETDVTAQVRAVIGKKIGVASVNNLSDAALHKVVESAETAARFQEDNPEFKSLPEPLPVQETDAGYCVATADCSPEQRARGAAAICNLSHENGLQAAGAFSTGVEEILVANSLGVMAYHCGTAVQLVTVIMSEDSSGYGSAASMDVTDINPEAIGRVAVDKALRSRNPGKIEPGTYTVILEPEAVADMVFALAMMGLDAMTVQEESSFMNHNFGKQITGDKITIWDDGHDPHTLIMPFDFEGVPKQRVTMIEKGVAKAVIYDTFTAGREEGKTSTGHALPAPNIGSLPLHLFLAPGDATREEMLASTERGIWVTRFHYTNPLHPIKTTLTGMTRDGTFLIENGKITRPLKNLRFTQSILEAFAAADMIGTESKLIKMQWGNFAQYVPAMKIREFRFTGTTEF